MHMPDCEYGVLTPLHLLGSWVIDVVVDDDDLSQGQGQVCISVYGAIKWRAKYTLRAAQQQAQVDRIFLIIVTLWKHRILQV